MKWLAKLGKVKPVPLASSASSLLLSGFFITQGVSYLESTPLKPTDDAPAKPRQPADAETARLSAEEIGKAVLARDIFDSTVGSIAWVDRPVGSAARDDEEGEEGVQHEVVEAPLEDCKNDLRLLAIIMNEDPTHSFGVIRKGASPSKQILMGTEVDSVKLLLLAPTHAYVREGGAPACRLPLYLTTTPPPPITVPAPVAAPEPKRSKKAPLFSEAELTAGIQEIGPDRYRVTRDIITRGMADAAGVVRGTKFQPQTGASGQRNQGVKLAGVAETSTLHKLGMREGDVLRTLNGVNLSTPDGMLGAYALLREQQTVTLSVMRDGRPKTLTYVFE